MSFALCIASVTVAVVDDSPIPATATAEQDMLNLPEEKVPIKINKSLVISESVLNETSST